MFLHCWFAAGLKGKHEKSEVLIKLTSEKASLGSDLFTMMALLSQCQKLTGISSNQNPHVVKNSPPFSHVLQDLNF